MSRLPLLLLVVTELMRVRTAVADGPSLKTRLERLYDKLERLTVAPPTEGLLEKLEQLNAIVPERDEFEELLTDDDEELLSAMQMWAEMSPEQIGGMAKELQLMRLEGEELKDEEDAFEEGWNDDEPVYPTDDWDQDDDMADATTSRFMTSGVTPSSIIRSETVLRAPALVDPIAATQRRPRILDDSTLSNTERSALRRAAIANMGAVLRAGRCLTPQPRWLAVRQLAPASDIVYMPPCVRLHRCAPDAGCCYSEAEVCAPVEGATITIPFYLHHADGNNSVNRMVFYNHTKCACVPRGEVQRRGARGGEELLLQSEWQPPTEEPKERETRDRETRDREEAGDSEESTAPPMMKRCTCPTLFLARTSERGCACVCDWSDASRRRDCLSQSRGREHFGLRDRVCISNGDCTYPTCEYGGYVRSNGRCPLRRFRRVRYHGKGTRYVGV